MKEFILHIKSHPEWFLFKKMLIEQRPHIVPHDPGNPNSVEEWKSLSAQQKGYDLCCALFQLNEE